MSSISNLLGPHTLPTRIAPPAVDDLVIPIPDQTTSFVLSSTERKISWQSWAETLALQTSNPAAANALAKTVGTPAYAKLALLWHDAAITATDYAYPLTLETPIAPEITAPSGAAITQRSASRLINLASQIQNLDNNPVGFASALLKIDIISQLDTIINFLTFLKTGLFLAQDAHKIKFRLDRATLLRLITTILPSFSIQKFFNEVDFLESSLVSPLLNLANSLAVARDPALLKAITPALVQINKTRTKAAQALAAWDNYSTNHLNSSQTYLNSAQTNLQYAAQIKEIDRILSILNSLKSGRLPPNYRDLLQEKKTTAAPTPPPDAVLQPPTLRKPSSAVTESTVNVLV